MPALSGKRFWVTGATGRLGTACVERLEKLGADVLPLVFPGAPIEPRRVPWGASHRPVAVSAREELEKLAVLAQPDAIIHFHWRTRKGPGSWERYKLEFSENVLENGFFWEWLGDSFTGKLVNISSFRVHDSASPYGATKIFVETLIDGLSDGRFKAAHLRLGTVASAGEHPSQLVTRLHRNAFYGEAMVLNLPHSTYLVDLDDAVDWAIGAGIADVSGRLEMIRNPYSNAFIASEFERLSGKRLSAEAKDLEPGKCDPMVNSDVARLEEDPALSWMSRSTLQQTLQKIIIALKARTER